MPVPLDNIKGNTAVGKNKRGREKKAMLKLSRLRPEGELASSSVYSNSAVPCSPKGHSLLHCAALAPPNQHLFVINTAHCAGEDSPKHLRVVENKNPPGLRHEREKKGSQTVWRAEQKPR